MTSSGAEGSDARMEANSIRPATNPVPTTDARFALLRRAVRMLRRARLLVSGRLLGRLKELRRKRALRKALRTSGLFDAAWYIEQNPDLRDATANPLAHYMLIGAFEGRDPHPLFASKYYLDQNPDVRAAGANPLEHFLSHGWLEGRDPHPLFASRYYLDQNAGVRAEKLNPLVHFVKHGGLEGRDPHPLFRSRYYLDQNPDIRAAALNPLIHYVIAGAAERRDPSPEFSSRHYLEKYPDVERAGDNPLVHFVLYGRQSGRQEGLSKRPDVLPCPLPPADGQTEWTGEAEFWRRYREREEQRRNAFHPRPLDLIRCEPGGEDRLLRRINFRPASAPTISIIVPVFNVASTVLECLASVHTFGHEIEYEVILADDASDAEQSERFARVSGANYIRNEKNLGFLLNCNNAARSARGRYLLFLNSDVQLLPGALAALVASFEPGVGIVGPKILYPSGHLQEAGCRIAIDGTAALIGYGEDPDLPEYNFRRTVEYVSGACLLIERKLFEDLGGFDPVYAPAYCEDADLCFRVRERGLRVIYEPAARVSHQLSATMRRLPNDFKRRQAAINTQKLVERWQGQIEADNRVSAIAIYLPQFHQIPENDLWWGSGFTEWKSVAKARPNYIGHDQPRQPADLGYYDLANPETFAKQIALARRYGIRAFSFYYYWFDNGRRILERPLETYLAEKHLDFPFCLSWANENWTRRWDGADKDILLQQSYTEEDSLALIHDVARYFADPRYLRIDGRPLFSVYRWALLPDPKATARLWRDECRRMGIGEIYLTAVESFDYATRLSHPMDIGCDAMIGFPPHDLGSPSQVPVQVTNLEFRGFVDSYLELALRSATRPGKPFTRFPGVASQWDNTPRRQNDSYILSGSDPGVFKAWLEQSFDMVRRLNGPGERFVFINAWNEWGEGAYLEPDTRYGHAYLTAVKHALEAPNARRLS